MKYTKTNTKKLYTSPELSIHELKFEGALLDVSTRGHGQIPEGEWYAPAPRLRKIKVEVVDEDDFIDDETIEWDLSSNQFKL